METYDVVESRAGRPWKAVWAWDSMGYRSVFNLILSVDEQNEHSLNHYAHFYFTELVGLEVDIPSMWTESGCGNNSRRTLLTTQTFFGTCQ